MTSSNYLKSGLRSGLAVPIMLAAVGLLLASLVLGLRSNIAHALGDENAGICGYTNELIRDAILEQNDDESYDCNRAADGDDGPAYAGDAVSDAAWGGAKADGSPLDLDLSGEGISTFKPGVGELDGFVRGARVDLRGNGLTVADIDLSDARMTHDADTRTYTNFGDSVSGTLNAAAPTADPTPLDVTAGAGGDLGLTFLLDGGSTTNNGFAVDTYEGVENGIVWLTFEYSEKPKEFGDANDDDGGVWMRVDIRIDHDDADGDATNGGDSSVIGLLINSNDPVGTLYAVPFHFRMIRRLRRYPTTTF